MSIVTPPTADYGWPSIQVDPAKLLALTESLERVPVTYRMDAKADPLSLQAGGFTELDCSGFSRWCLFHALGQPDPYDFPDGSVQQHEWVKAQGLKESSYSSAEFSDGVVRIAFLTPEDGGGVGHVVLICNGRTMESHGGVGVGQRDWDAEKYPFMSLMQVFVLCR